VAKRESARHRFGQLPTRWPVHSRNDPGCPGSRPGCPESRPARPGPHPGCPGARPGCPGARPGCRELVQRAREVVQRAREVIQRAREMSFYPTRAVKAKALSHCVLPAHSITRWTHSAPLECGGKRESARHRFGQLPTLWIYPHALPRPKRRRHFVLPAHSIKRGGHTPLILECGGKRESARHRFGQLQTLWFYPHALPRPKRRRHFVLPTMAIFSVQLRRF
jgi:hypothetical protein